MAIYAISDLHLAGAREKNMNIFGDDWYNHSEKLCTNWKSTVKAEDTVLIPGDTSWAMSWQDFEPDLEFLASLPGDKILSRGNHCYFWQSQSKMQSLLPDGIVAINNSAIVCNTYAIAGVKGWLTPGNRLYDKETDEKYFLRERGRLTLALRQASQYNLPVIVQMHFPPLAHPEETGFTDLFTEYDVRICIYGHLHNGNWAGLTSLRRRGIQYQLVSADYLAFKPILISS